MQLITAKGLRKDYNGFRAIDGISFNLQVGNIMALLGPNGAGKTTVMKCLMGMIPFEGYIKIFGLDPSRDGKAVRRKVGYLPQQNSLYENMTVIKNMLHWAEIRGASRRSVENALEIVDLWIYRDTVVQKLSAGMKQRVMFATSLIGDPEVLLLDEPTTNLDIKWRNEFRKILESFKDDKTIIIASHFLKETQFLCNNVLILDQGKEVISGQINSLIEELDLPNHLYINTSTPESAVKFLRDNGYDAVVKSGWIMLSCRRDEKLLVLNLVQNRGYVVKDFKSEEPTLEDLFLKVTRKGIGIQVS